MFKAVLYGLLVASMFLLPACAGVPHVSEADMKRPGFIFKNSPAGITLYLDGKKMGDAGKWNGEPNILYSSPGQHRVSVRAGCIALFDDDVVLEASVKTITVLKK